MTAIGKPLNRIDGPLKVRGAAPYAFEQHVTNPAHVFPLLSTIAAGRIAQIDAEQALAEPGVIAVVTHENAIKLNATGDPQIDVLQSDEVGWYGQFIGAVIAETPEIARYAAGLVQVHYEPRTHDVEMRGDREDVVKPHHAALFGEMDGELQNGMPADTSFGDVDAALAAADFRIDQTYTTPINHHNPLEPHAAVVEWADDSHVTVYMGSQGVSMNQGIIAALFGLEPANVRIVAPYTGGGFGSKIRPHSYATLAVMVSKIVGRSVKLNLTRQQMFSTVGYRTPTSSRVQLGATADGKLTAVAHDTVQGSSNAYMYAEQIGVCTRLMYDAPNRRTTHRLAMLDMPVPTIMRAPGESQGMFALESAIDEMAEACGIDPVEFRIINEPELHPESGNPFSSRKLKECLTEGARRFDWANRSRRREGAWLYGSGVASATYPSPRFPGNSCRITHVDGRYSVQIAAVDIGTGTWTALSQIAADALGVDISLVDLEIGDSSLPMGSTAGFSSGLGSWGNAVMEAAKLLKDGKKTETEVFGGNPKAAEYEMNTFGAHFVEVRVNSETGEIRVPRMLGVFDAGRIINPKTARSQLVGAMTQGLSQTLHEATVVDTRYGQFVNRDFAGYHFAANADVGTVEAYWVESKDEYTNELGTKGIGEIGIVGMTAAIANAVYHATGIRVRDLPITLDKIIGQI
ncbi:xanthine dehydrogenase family protein molybdopterin-binding subunit [Kibdelosporangium philippinense]|uniref:Xanthine dehydrogenase family protein molybdopterin-binding subunit n=1 Tax=Kibdelosporangium philippinense TaxID=211113 RepID=A0ABS8ZTF8_9PSEU|nr:xanthine dehydrogenase family protein molybdopterin-binding subunit [Kibdelosporangium philippinense]MCE7011014.1 xanthine dehydrogenase family protein molybdopterin-binding subunit [Kibdelosporangium philippinense]